MTELPAYAELHCVSNFSFLRGASHPAELVERAAALGYSALAITDECSLAGVVRAHVEAKKHKLRLLIGTEVQFTTQSGEAHAKLVLLATDHAAYGNLSEFITLARMRADKGSYRAHLSDLEGAATDYTHLAGLPGCLALLIPARDSPFERLFTQAMWLKNWFAGRAWIAVENLLRATDSALIDRVECVALMTESATGCRRRRAYARAFSQVAARRPSRHATWTCRSQSVALHWPQTPNNICDHEFG